MKNKPRLLILEDESELVQIMKNLLEDLYVVFGTDSLEKAKELLAEEQIDIAISDLNIPGVEKNALLKAIHSGYKEIPVVILTGFADKANILDSFREGAFEVLEKPVNRSELIQTLEKALTHKALLERRYSFLMAQFCHEISTPTTGILMIARLLQDKIRQLPDGGSNDNLLKSADRILTLSRRISDLIKMTKVNLISCEHFEFRDVSLRNLIKESVAICESSLDLKGTEIDFAQVSADLRINCSPLKISQVFVNLIKNSFHAIQERTEKWIKISADQKNDRIELIFVDSGDGIPENIAKKIFQREFTTKTFGSGSGLGLSFCLHVVEEHGGVLTLDLKAKKTTFLMQLPLKPVKKTSISE